jgi:nucleoside phosphorylase
MVIGGGGSLVRAAWSFAVVTALASLSLTGIALSGSAGASSNLSALPGCASSHVLLLGSYPSEVSDNLSQEVLAPDQPTVIDHVDFYAGTLSGNRIITAVAGPSPAVTYATTALALRHFDCTSAVVFSGTAGGGGESQLGDVTAPAAWTSDNGATFSPVSPPALAVAQEIQANATSQLATSAPIDDGPCLCQGDAHGLQVVPILRTPRLLVGGYGTTYGGDSDFCLAGGGMLEGCNPCPPDSSASLLTITAPVSFSGTSTTGVAISASSQARAGTLIAGAHSLLTHESAPPPTELAETANAPSYVADDQQTTGAQQAANAFKVPFIAFRGISDTSAVGNLWPFEWLIYQQLAADNSATAARLWIQAWSHR